MFLATVADGQTAAHEVKGSKTANAHPESAFGWVLIGWAFGPSLIIDLLKNALPQLVYENSQGANLAWSGALGRPSGDLVC